MSSSKDWHAVAHEDFRATSEEDDHSDFDLLKDSEMEYDSQSHSKSTSVADSDTEAEFDTESQTNEPLDTPATPMSPKMESAFALSKEIPLENEEETKPINFDADDDLTETNSLDGMDQEAWQRTNAYMKDIQQALRDSPAVRVQGNERYMKILLVGENGLGKEAFIKNVFAPYCSDNDLPVNVCGPETSLQSFRDAPENYCTEVCIDVDEARTKIHYNMQDTPGTHLDKAGHVIIEHIRNQNREYMAKEEDLRRVVPMNTLPDPRVDIALYFLSPFFLKPQDISIITHLSRFVPVLPIIAKADALTTAELTKYRAEIVDQLCTASERVGRQVMHQFSAKELQEAGIKREVPPFAVITSSEIDNEVGRHWFTRTFPWGKCEVMSSNHSDLPALKSLLFESCFESIKAATETRFYAARESFLTTRALSKAASSKELPSTQLHRRQRIALLETANAVKQSVPSSPKKTNKSSKPQGFSWGWGWGLVTVAILVQLIALGYYAKNVASLKSMVATYQAESAAEKQVLREQIYAIEHKKDWRKIGVFQGVGNGFSALGTNLKVAASHTAQAISDSTKSASNSVCQGVSKAGPALGNSFWSAFQSSKKNTISGGKAIGKGISHFGQSLKNLSSKAVSRISRENSFFSNLSKNLKAQNSKFLRGSSRIFGSIKNSISSGMRKTGKGFSQQVSAAKNAVFRVSRHAGKSISSSFKSMGIKIRKGGHSIPGKIGQSFKLAGKKISSSCKKSQSNLAKALKKAGKNFQAEFKFTTRCMGRAAKNLGGNISKNFKKSLHSSGEKTNSGLMKTNNFFKGISKQTIQSSQKIWAQQPSMKEFQSWISQNSGGISRILRRAAIANALQ